jgi:hypothetical protein
VDSVLAVVPQARVEVPGPVPAVLRFDPRVVEAGSAGLAACSAAATDDGTGGARVRIDIRHAVLVSTPDAPRDSRLAGAIEAVGVGTLGEVVFTDAEGAALMTVSSRRAVLRRSRWSDPSLFDTLVEHAPWLAPIASEPSVAAYLGGWG